jgi:gluconate 5-dehydrogenase
MTGGSRGIGKAIAKGFADRGARVIISSRNVEVLSATAKEIGAHAMPCDVADGEAVTNLVADVLDRFGHIDTLVNDAGVNRRKPALELTDEDYDYVMDINLRGAWRMSQAVGRHMVERGQGCQINIASLNNDRPLNQVIAYAMSKAGLVHMTRALALEWGPAGVRVNALAPGFILTALTEKAWANPIMLDWGLAHTPMRRLGRPEDLVGTALFLASDASAFMTGQTLFVDGGCSAGMEWPIDKI